MGGQDSGMDGLTYAGCLVVVDAERSPRPVCPQLLAGQLSSLGTLPLMPRFVTQSSPCYLVRKLQPGLGCA